MLCACRTHYIPDNAISLLNQLVKTQRNRSKSRFNVFSVVSSNIDENWYGSLIIIIMVVIFDRIEIRPIVNKKPIRLYVFATQLYKIS